MDQHKCTPATGLVAAYLPRSWAEDARTVKPVVGKRSPHDRPDPRREGPVHEVSAVSGEEPNDGQGDGHPQHDAPLADLAADVNQRRNRPTEELFDRAFSEEPFDDLEEDSVWSSIDEGETSDFGAVGEVVEAGERTYVVSKRNFCERCHHFSGPPDVHCTHGGTEIREFVDMDHVRLHACPIVEERGLEDERPLD